MSACRWSMAELLPHQPPMILVHGVDRFDDRSVQVAAVIGPDHPFLDDGLVPAHVGIELMAQACGVFAGIEAKTLDLPVKLGFLLGTRKFTAAAPGFEVGWRLEVGAGLVFRDEELAVFDCTVGHGGKVLAEAQLTLFQPKDAEAMARVMNDAG